MQPVCFPQAFDSVRASNATGDPLQGVTVAAMKVRHLSTLWMTLWSLMALREVTQVLDIGLGGRDATTIGLAGALESTYKTKKDMLISRMPPPNCRLIGRKRCCVSFMVTLEKDEVAMLRARELTLKLGLPQLLPLAGSQLVPLTKQQAVPEETRAHLSSAHRSPKQAARAATTATAKVCQRFRFDLVLLDARAPAADSQLELVKRLCRPLFIVVHGLPTAVPRGAPGTASEEAGTRVPTMPERVRAVQATRLPSPRLAPLGLMPRRPSPPASPSATAAYEVFLRSSGMGTMRPQCELVGCSGEPSADNYTIYKRVGAAYNRGDNSVVDLRDYHWRRYAAAMVRRGRCRTLLCSLSPRALHAR